MDCNGQNQHRCFFEPTFRAFHFFGIQMKVRCDTVEQEKKGDSQQETDGRGKECQFSHRGGPFDGGDQQAPDRGGDHNTCRKTGEDTLCPPLQIMACQKNGRGARRRPEEGDRKAPNGIDDFASHYCFHPRSSARALPGRLFDFSTFQSFPLFFT